MILRRLSILFLCSLGVFLSASSTGVEAASPVQIIDDLGQSVEIPAPAKRIIPLYGAFAEMLYAIGAGQCVSARTQADKFPPEIVALPAVGTHMRPNIETIVGLKPDLVVQSGTRQAGPSDLERLRAAGIAVAVFAPNDFEGIFSTMERLGILTGKQEEAAAAVAGLRARLESVKTRIGNVEKRNRAFFEIRAEPLTAAGRSSIVHRILLAAGADNVIENEKPIVQFNLEALLLADPDVYIVQSGPMNKNPVDPVKRDHFNRLRAIREGRTIYADEFLYSRPGPRCVDAVEELAAFLYPDRFGR